MGSLVQDVRFALRTFGRAPLFALIAVVTMAFGIGANTAIFSVVDSLVLRPLAFPNSDQLVFVEQINPMGERSNLSWPDMDDWRKQNQVFAGMAAFHGDSLIVTGGPSPQRLDGMTVTSNLFDVLASPPAMGRGFAPEEEQEGKNHVLVLTWAAWKTYFGGEADVVGRTIVVDDIPYTVVGVTGEKFRFAPLGDNVDAYLPVPRAFDTQLKTARGGHYLWSVARLKPGVTVEQANANLATIAAAQGAAYPDTNAGRGVRATLLHERLTEEARPALLILLGLVALVLLIACANVANLLLARASARHRELAIRLALGAGRARLVRQMLTESVLLSLVGAGLGVVLALWSLDTLRSLIPPELASVHEIAIDARVLAFTIVLAVATGLAFGLVPALQASGQSPGDALKEAGLRSTAHGGRQRARSLLVAGEVAIATMLLVASGLMLRSFARVSQVDPGFRPDDLVTTYVPLPDTRYREDAQLIAFYRRLAEALETVPGATGIAIGAPLPFSGVGIGLRFTIVGLPPPPPNRPNVADMSIVNPGWFAALGIPIKAGRAFDRTDDDPGAPLVMVVSETFARRYFPGENAVGKRIMLSWGNHENQPREIVGVVGDVHRHTLEQAANPGMYAPFAQGPFQYIGIAVRTGATTGMAATLRQVVSSIDKDQPLTEFETMRQLMRNTMVQRRLSTLLASIFGGVALALAIIGVYGVMSYTVRQRVGEIGIRMALGARPGDVMRMIVRHGLVLAVAGLAVGLCAAFPLARVLASLLWGVTPADPITYAAISGVLLGVALLASWLPSRRAARIDPMVALRSE